VDAEWIIQPRAPQAGIAVPVTRTFAAAPSPSP